MECAICCEQAKIHNCFTCKKGSCLNCIKRWILSQDVATCMNCEENWKLSFLRTIFPQAFLNTTYKNHIIEVIEKEEDNKIRATEQMKVYQICRFYLETKNVKLDIPYVEFNNERRNNLILMNEIRMCRRVAPWIEDQIEDSVIINPRYIETPIIREQQRLLTKAILKQLNGYMPKIEVIDEMDNVRSEDVGSRADIKYNCPVPSCKGIVIGGRCINCLQRSCDLCWEIREKNHACEKDRLENVIDVLANTTACPNCFTRINRYTGCSKMICTRCNTNFDYLTGKAYDLTNLNQEDQGNQGETRYIVNRSVQDNSHKLKLRIYYALGLIDKVDFIRRNYYFWRVNQLENEELAILNKYDEREEKVSWANEALATAAKHYGLAPLVIGLRDPHRLRYSIQKVDKNIEEIIQRFI